MHHIVVVSVEQKDFFQQDVHPALSSIDPSFRVDKNFGTVTIKNLVGIQQNRNLEMRRAWFKGKPGPILAKLDELATPKGKPNATKKLLYEWDPQIKPCRGSYRDPVRGWGTWEDVQRESKFAEIECKTKKGQGVYVFLIDTGINLSDLITSTPSPFQSSGYWNTKFDGQSGGFESARNVAGEIAKRIFKTVPSQYEPYHAPSNSHGSMMAFDTAVLAPDAFIVDLPLLQSGALPPLLSNVTSALFRLIEIIGECRKAKKDVPKIVINNSWQLRDPAANGSWDFNRRDSFFNQAIDRIVKEEAAVLFASGNCGNRGSCASWGSDTIYGANSHPEVLTVSAASAYGSFITVSSRGRGWIKKVKPDICASSYFEGSGIDVIGVPKGRRILDGGTSAACAVTSGLVASLRSTWDTLSPKDLFDAIRNSSRVDPNEPFGSVHDPDYGNGLVNVHELLQNKLP